MVKSKKPKTEPSLLLAKHVLSTLNIKRTTAKFAKFAKENGNFVKRKGYWKEVPKRGVLK